MKKIILIILFIVIFNIAESNELSEKAKEKVKSSLLNNNSLGNYFVVAFPPNDRGNNGLQILALYIASQEDANVKISTPDGIIKEIVVLKNKVVSVSTENSLNWSLMLDENDEEIPSNKGIIIESDKPISVYVLNSKLVTTEGYLAIPVKRWGKEYIHCSYYDFNEAFRWRTGFTVLASEDRTKISMVLKGRGSGFKTLRGRAIGDTITKILNKGQTFIMQGTGESRGSFDLTGTIISADKPIGVISSHERCMIPPFVVTNGRDHLSAMMPSVDKWGKNYATIELERETDKGDFFRIVAGEDNTTYEVRWYDKKTGEYIGIWDGILDKKGDFEEYSKISAQMPHENESIRGISYFTADKPIFVMQYSYSAKWDNSPEGNFDPFMFPVTQVEQFTRATIFQTPSNNSDVNEYTDNFLNLIVFADAETEQERQEQLATLNYDGTQLISIYPELLTQKFPLNNTPFDNKLYWVTINTDIGSHTLNGEVKFGGYVYGFSEFDSYGWPAAAAYQDLTSIDTISPSIEIVENCGSFEVLISDKIDITTSSTTNGNPPQIDRGLSQFPSYVEKNNISEPVIDYDNVKEISKGEEWFGSPILEEINLFYEVEDKRKDATFHIVIPDNTYQNYAEKEVKYFADKLNIEEEIDFGIKKLNTSNELIITLKSDKDYETNVNEIGLSKIVGDYFELISPKNAFTIPAKGEVDVKIQYTPSRNYTEAEEYPNGRYDLDSLILKTDCLEFSFPVIGRGSDFSSVEDITLLEQDLEIFPNPANEILNFKPISDYNFYEFEIINSKGNIVFKGSLEFNSNTINISNIENGSYFLRLISKNESIIGKFQKIK